MPLSKDARKYRKHVDDLQATMAGEFPEGTQGRMAHNGSHMEKVHERESVTLRGTKPRTKSNMLKKPAVVRACVCAVRAHVVACASWG